jgi:hypothetical protein
MARFVSCTFRDMGALTETTFTERVDAGCTGCGTKKLLITSYVEGKFPLIGGEPAGAVTWAYKGETFVDGVFEIRCAACKHEVFSSTICPRCNAEGGLARALETENAHVVPKACPQCGIDSVSYRAFVPANVTYEGKRAGKARTECDLYDAGFHAFRAECKSCGTFDPREGVCPVCDAPGPIRAQPR